MWRKAPKTPWPDVPPGRILCQKCYEAHRMAAERDESQAIIQRLFIHNGSGGKSMSANVTSDEEDLQGDMRCDICALDIIDDSITYDYEIGWYRLQFSNYDAIDTARPPG